MNLYQFGHNIYVVAADIAGVEKCLSSHFLDTPDLLFGCYSLNQYAEETLKVPKGTQWQEILCLVTDETYVDMPGDAVSIVPAINVLWNLVADIDIDSPCDLCFTAKVWKTLLPPGMYNLE